MKKYNTVLVKVFCDEGLPEEDGLFYTNHGYRRFFAATKEWWTDREVKFWYKEEKDVYLLTGQQLRERLDEVYNSGRMDTLTRPIKREEILSQENQYKS